MKTLNNWQETLEYVNRLGLVSSSTPIGRKQQVLMANVKAIETMSTYPLQVRYSRKNDVFEVNKIFITKAVH